MEDQHCSTSTETGSENQEDQPAQEEDIMPPPKEPEEPEESIHPLQNKWQFWYYQYQTKGTWEENLRAVKEVSTVEDFWAVHRSMKPASEIGFGCYYFFFKYGLKPMWEDEGNRLGGRWLINFDKSLNFSRAQIDEKWQEVLLCLIGEAFGVDGVDICGAVMDVRHQGYKISIWTKDCKNTDKILNIGKIIKERLQLGDIPVMTYKKHEDTANKTRGNHLFVL